MVFTTIYEHHLVNVPDVNECDSSPCYGEATCLDSLQSFVCMCPGNYTGELCQIGE